MKILIASNNKHKVEEIKSILKNSNFQGIEFVTPNEISDISLEVEENGHTFSENAEIKARAFFEHFKLPVISDDSGLEVQAINWAPGVLSARYSGIDSTDALNRKKLIEELSLLNLDNSQAHFKCNICFFDGIILLQAEGKCKGKIILEERGTSGFGYDPLFIPDGFELTFAELSENIKNSISHRGIALSNFLPIFAKYYYDKEN